jgi:hypothetical protein
LLDCFVDNLIELGNQEWRMNKQWVGRSGNIKSPYVGYTVTHSPEIMPENNLSISSLTLAALVGASTKCAGYSVIVLVATAY